MYQGYYDCYCKKECKKPCCKKEYKKCCKKPTKKCCKKNYCCENEYNEQGFGSIYSLLILILIVCQFCKKDHDKNEGIVDNSILFIITLFLLVYCNGCKEIFNFGVGGGCGC